MERMLVHILTFETVPVILSSKTNHCDKQKRIYTSLTQTTYLIISDFIIEKENTWFVWNNILALQAHSKGIHTNE